MARSKTPKVTEAKSACGCDESRRAGAATQRRFAAPDAETYDCKEFGNEIFCICRVCGSRWRVTVTCEYDDGMSDTLYAWDEPPWTEESLEAKRYEGLYEAARERERRRGEDYWRQRNPNAGPQVPMASAPPESVAPPRERQVEPVEEQVAPLEWRWTDVRGVSHGCRIEEARLAVWTEDPFGGTGTSYEMRDVLEGRHSASLPPGIASRVREAAARLQEVGGS